MSIDLRLEAAERTAKEIAAECGSATAIAADVSCSEDFSTIVNRALERFGCIDVIHNNVGIEIGRSRHH